MFLTVYLTFSLFYSVIVTLVFPRYRLYGPHPLKKISPTTRRIQRWTRLILRAWSRMFYYSCSDLTSELSRPRCCACPKTKSTRDDCFLKFDASEASEKCKEQVENHLACMRALGFKLWANINRQTLEYSVLLIIHHSGNLYQNLMD
jgi:cytochrome c oxidase assembly protein subunit 17